MLPMNNDNRKDYQTVLEEHTPLVCNDAVEKKSASTRLATLLSIGIAVFAFLAMANSISGLKAELKAELKAGLADHQSQLQALTVQSTPLSELKAELKAALADHQSQLQALTVQSTPLLGAALQGSAAVGDACAADNECGSGDCQTKPYAFCVASARNLPLLSACKFDQSCASGYCDYYGKCKKINGTGGYCIEDKGCASNKCLQYRQYSECA